MCGPGLQHGGAEHGDALSNPNGPAFTPAHRRTLSNPNGPAFTPAYW